MQAGVKVPFDLAELTTKTEDGAEKFSEQRQAGQIINNRTGFRLMPCCLFDQASDADRRRRSANALFTLTRSGSIKPYFASSRLGAEINKMKRRIRVFRLAALYRLGAARPVL